MRIRISLVFDITRGRNPDIETEQFEHRDVDSFPERAESHPIGFVPHHEQPQRPDERRK